jgi:hypothetical protein
MIMNDHTPGPWKYHIGRGIDPRFHIQTVGGYQIAETPKNGIACGIAAVNEANAKLISAAPDLLESLIVVTSELENEVGDYLRRTKHDEVHTRITKALANAIKAIAKATQ